MSERPNPANKPQTAPDLQQQRLRGLEAHERGVLPGPGCQSFKRFLLKVRPALDGNKPGCQCQSGVQRKPGSHSRACRRLITGHYPAGAACLLSNSQRLGRHRILPPAVAGEVFQGQLIEVEA